MAEDGLRISGAWRTMKRGVGALVAVVALVLSTAAPAFAQNDDAAKKAFEDGIALEKKGNYEGALAKFSESRQLKETLGNRFHTAFCLEMTGQLAAAMTEYESVEVAAREQKKQDIADQTKARLEPLKAKVPQIAVKLQPVPKDAEVLVDGKLVKPALLVGTAFRIDSGDHTVTAHAPEHEKFTKKLTLAEGANVTVDVVLEKKSAVAAAPAAGPMAGEKGTPFTEPPPEQPKSPPKTAAIVSTVVAGTLLAGGIVSYLIADGKHSDNEKLCPTKPDCSDERDSVRLFDAISLSAFIGAGVVGALAVVLWVSKPVGSAAGGNSATTGVRVMTRGSWVGLSGSF